MVRSSRQLRSEWRGQVDSTFETYAKSGSFLWLNEDVELSALVQTTNVNSSQLRAPPYRTVRPRVQYQRADRAF